MRHGRTYRSAARTFAKATQPAEIEVYAARPRMGPPDSRVYNGPVAEKPYATFLAVDVGKNRAERRVLEVGAVPFALDHASPGRADRGHADTPRVSIPPDRNVPPEIPPRLRGWRLQAGGSGGEVEQRRAPVVGRLLSALRAEGLDAHGLLWTPSDNSGRMACQPKLARY